MPILVEGIGIADAVGLSSYRFNQPHIPINFRYIAELIPNHVGEVNRHVEDRSAALLKMSPRGDKDTVPRTQRMEQREIRRPDCANLQQIAD